MPSLPLRATHSLEQVHNYHERGVLDAVLRRVGHLPGVSADMVADLVCVALNQLPPRYVRHDVDMVFYLTEAERHEAEVALEAAVALACGKVLGAR